MAPNNGSYTRRLYPNSLWVCNTLWHVICALDADGFAHLGRLNQTEYDDRISPILTSFNGEREHLHNTLIAAIYGNVTREMPDQGPAPWVSTNDKPLPSTGAKPPTGDATERRLKGEVMQLPAKDRRRIKDLTGNEVSFGKGTRFSGRMLTEDFSVRVPILLPGILQIRCGSRSLQPKFHKVQPLVYRI